jgi:hypothetical protein
LSSTGEQTDNWKARVKELAVELGLMTQAEDLNAESLEKIKNGLANDS